MTFRRKIATKSANFTEHSAQETSSPTDLLPVFFLPLEVHLPLCWAKNVWLAGALCAREGCSCLMCFGEANNESRFQSIDYKGMLFTANESILPPR